MAEKLTQGIINKVGDDHPKGTQLHDAEVPGLRVVVGSKSSSYKFVGRINDGSKRYVSVVIGRTSEVSLRSARDRAGELRLSLRRGIDPRSPKATVPSVGDALDRYFEGRGDELSPRTVNWYRQKIDGPLSGLRKTPADKVDRETVRALHERLTRQSGAYGAMRVLKLILNDVARTHDLPPNPVTRGVRMNKEKARDWAVGPDEMPALWSALDRMEDRTRRACWLLMLTTGLRSGNARSVRWEHVDGDVLFVPKAKSGRSFSLPLPKIVVDALAEVKELNATLESEFAFPSPASKSGQIEQMARTQSFPYAPHQMRHTYRTHALEAGVDFQSITMPNGGKLKCECCDTVPVDVCGDAGDRSMEAHHKVPIEELQPDSITPVTEMAMVCATCHRVIHSEKPCLTIEKVRELIGATATYVFSPGIWWIGFRMN